MFTGGICMYSIVLHALSRFVLTTISTASVPEVMKSLNTLADQGKVLYLGISDTPAWIVSKANQYARDHGLRQFVVYQGKWSAAERDFERDIILMCESEGMALAPWGKDSNPNFIAQNPDLDLRSRCSWWWKLQDSKS